MSFVTSANYSVTLAFLIAFLSCPVGADYQEGLDAYLAGNYDKALGEWLDVTRSPPEEVPPGILAETYYAIAMLYWVGQGVPQDTVIAAKWLKQSAEMHHAGAQTKLGYLSSSGQGVAQNDFEAFKWFQMAAWQGDADAQYNLAVLYREGLGVTANQEKALEWFREAASNGDAESAQIIAQYESSVPAPAPAAAPITDPTPGAPVDVTGSAPVSAPATDPVPEALVDVAGAAPAPAPIADPIPEALVDAAGSAPASALTTDPTPEALVDVADATSAPAPTADPVPEALVDVAVTTPPAGDQIPAADLPVDSGNTLTAEVPDAKPAFDAEVVAGELANETAVEEFDADPPGGELQEAAWILDRDPGHYTIQVIALRDKAKLVTYIADHPDWAPWAIYEQSLKSQPLWVLVQGDYAELELVRAAAAKFPADLQKRDQLWIRRFSMVQGLLP